MLQQQPTNVHLEAEEQEDEYLLGQQVCTRNPKAKKTKNKYSRHIDFNTLTHANIEP